MSQIFKYHVDGRAEVFDTDKAPDHSTGWFNSPVDAAAEKEKMVKAVSAPKIEAPKVEPKKAK